MFSIWLGVSGCVASGMRLNPCRAASSALIIVTSHDWLGSNGRTRCADGRSVDGTPTSDAYAADAASVSPA